MQGFVSYSHRDFEIVGAFMTHLVPAGPSGPHSFWIDRDLTAGRIWDDDIRSRIAASDLFVLLGSANFAASAYIHDHEWPAIEARVAACKGLVVPVMLRDNFHFARKFGHLHNIPVVKGHLRPVGDWHPQNNGHTAAVRQLFAAVELHLKVPAGASP